MKKILLRDIAHARSGDKGNSANIGVIAYTQEAYIFLQTYLTADIVQKYFESLGVTHTQRFELPNLHAFNFVLRDVLAGGGSRSLRIDTQGKALGQVLLQMQISVPDHILKGSI